ncbi:MAG: hypothetical protein AB7Q17_06395 [Phycisphaerae bacterium]
MSAAAQTRQMSPRRPHHVRRIGVGLALSTAMVVGGAWGVARWSKLAGQSAIVAQLSDDDPRVRRAAALHVADEPRARLMRAVVARLDAGEPDEAAREALVFALSRSNDQFERAAAALTHDPSGFVRAAAWYAAARIDRERFEALVAGRSAPTDEWDHIGAAQARMYLGTYAGVPDLLRAAADGDERQREIASRALYRGVQPLLEAIGRWPANAPVDEGEIWPREFAQEIARRVATIDLQALHDASRPHWQRSLPILRNVARLTSAREVLRRFLFAG